MEAAFDLLTIIVDNVHDLTGMKSKFCVNASESLNPLVFPQRSGRQKAQAANEELRVEEEASSLPLPFFLRGRDSHEIRSGAEEEEKAAEAEPEKEDNNAVRPRPSVAFAPVAPARCRLRRDATVMEIKLPTSHSHIPSFPFLFSISLLPTLATLGRAAESRNLGRNSPGPRRAAASHSAS